RRLAHVRGVRAARRAGDDRFRRSAPAADADRARADREALARADDGAHRGAEKGRRREDLDEPGSVAARGGVVVPAGEPAHPEAVGGAVPEGPHRVRHARRPGSARAALLAALLQHARGRREGGRRDEEVHGERRVGQKLLYTTKYTGL